MMSDETFKPSQYFRKRGGGVGQKAGGTIATFYFLP